uniref:Uncharacterized protein n=1 Tax=Rhizophora mucronata TaxID=61149 RepID=A0A2P2QF03_RHIMU
MLGLISAFGIVLHFSRAFILMEWNVCNIIERCFTFPMPCNLRTHVPL